MQLKFYQNVLTKYYVNIALKEKHKSFDYVFVLRGEYSTQKGLLFMKETFTNAKFILYMWDSIKNNKNIQQKWIYFDDVYSFDRVDCINNSKIKHLPLYYIDQFKNHVEEKSKYDIVFIGTGHGDRPKIIKQISKICDREGLSFYSYIYLPHKLIFLRNKLFNKNYAGITLKDIHFELLPLNTISEIYSKCKCVIDIESASQSGLTMRTIEVFGSKKKLITTNKDIVNYDLYSKENILVIDRNNIYLDKNFVLSSYKPVSESLYKKYTLNNWFKNMLED